MDISLLHTGQIHAANFERIFHSIDPSITVSHTVRQDLLDRAREHGTDSIREDTLQALDKLTRADAVLCTCSTLGPWTDLASETHAHIIRVDRPLMEAACEDGSDILVVICLASTRTPTLELLQSVADQKGVDINPAVLLCDQAWSHFEAGDTDAYAEEIAQRIRATLATRKNTDSIILAQASMQPAQTLLTDLDVPVRSSPELAVRQAIATATSRSS